MDVLSGGWDRKRVLVVGAGRSGLAACRVLCSVGADVTLTDIQPEEKLAGKNIPSKVRLVAGYYPSVKEGEYDLVVTSPGVPSGSAPLTAAMRAGIPVWSEIELAWRLKPVTMAAITGTNGKTTTTALIGQMFRDAGMETVVAGNIGLPLVEEVVRRPEGVLFAVEVSSFQLETTSLFAPRVAVILNLTEDHLDRHGDMEGYASAKARIFAHQTGDDFTVLNFDDPLTRRMGALTPGRVVYFSCRHELGEGVFLSQGKVVILQEGRRTEILPVKELSLRGRHNWENCLAATAAAWVMGVPADTLAHTLSTFPGVPHRLESVGTVDGVLYVNDSKGTNPDATIRALESFEEKVILIAGGRNKGSAFTNLAGKMQERLKHLILLGEAAPDLEAAALAAGYRNLTRVAGLREAVDLARQIAVAGDVVLLSPACASWDQFANYEERGRLFKDLVLGNDSAREG